MKRILQGVLMGAFFMLACLGCAHAQGITRVCDQVVGPGGGNNCPEALGSAPLPGLSTTVEPVKATGGVVSIVHCFNPNSSQIYIQLFNATPTNVTLGVTKPVAFIPIGQTSTGGWSTNPLPVGGFTTAISAAATTTAEGSGAPSTAPDCDIYYN